MASHVSHCMAKAYACRTHGMPCVIMHGPFETYKYGSSHSVCGAANSVREGSSKEKEEEGKKGEEKGRKGKAKGRKRKEKERRKEKKKGEEERGEKKRKRKECCTVSKPRRQRTRTALQEVDFFLLWLFYA